MILSILRVYLISSIAVLNTSGSYGFVPLCKSGLLHPVKSAIDASPDSRDWISIIEVENNGYQSPVRKLVIEEGSGDIAQEGSAVEIEYTGTLIGEQDWSSYDVVSCWLSELQGLSHLSDVFLAKDIDGALLMDETKFTEDFCMNELEISNKIQAKKLVMAAKRIAKQQQNHETGAEFDSSIERGKNFSFVLGGGKVIKAMDLIVSTMKVGEQAELICRSDYAYGSEGLRSSKGDIIVPPFATLHFRLKLVKAE